MKTLFVLTSIVLCSFLSFSQEKSIKNKLDNSIRNWTELKSFDQVSIDFKFEDCDASMGYDKEVIHLKITNKTSEKITMTWHMWLYFNGVCKTCDYPQEYTYTLNLEPNQTLEGDCSLNSDNRLSIFSKFNDSRYTGGSYLTDFDMHNMKITSIK